MSDPWEVNIFGNAGQRAFEISVVRRGNIHGKRSFGWFSKNKLLITHNGGPCEWPLTQKVWDKCVQLARDVAAELNAEEARPE